MLHKRMNSYQRVTKALEESEAKVKFKIDELQNELNICNSKKSRPKDNSIVKTLEIVIGKKLEEVVKKLMETFIEEV